MSNEVLERKKLTRNDEFAFLYKYSKIRPTIISCLLHTPEFTEALKAHRDSRKPLDDMSIYKVVRSTYLKMLEDGTGYLTAKRVMKAISKDVLGDPNAWKS